jgi:hypothetical protein
VTAPAHTRDSDCTVVNGECVECLVDHSGQCPCCGGRGFCLDDCRTLGPVDTAREQARAMEEARCNYGDTDEGSWFYGDGR